MTHDQFVEALSQADGSPPAREALDHAATCAACRQLLEALELAAEDDRAVVPPPPAGYWDDFQARLDARLGREGAQARRTGAVRRARWWLAAAAIAGAAIVGFGTWRGLHLPGSNATAAGTPASDIALAVIAQHSPDELDAAVAALGVGAPDPIATIPLPGDALGSIAVDAATPGAAPATSPAAPPSDLDFPLDAVEAELAGELDAAAQRELARRLAEAS